MILQTYYRQNHYKPTDALKGSMSLLLEIPFFMAAYNFLSELELLNGAALGPIGDLGAPDALLVIAGVSINVLPILMTVINLISGAIYTKGFPMKSKIQLYGMALIFLVFLYDSPSGLVFYWTLNNLFSLVKNIFYKLKNPRFVLGILSSLAGLGVFVLAFVYPSLTVRRMCMLLGAGVVLQLPMVMYYFGKNAKPKQEITLTKQDKFLFHAGCLMMTLLTGLLIPSSVIKASPQEFINRVLFTNPLHHVLSASLLAAGTFMVWFGIFYMLAKPAGKKTMGLGMWIVVGVAVVDYMFFGNDYGTLSSELVYDTYPPFAAKTMLLNLAVLSVVAGGFILIWKKKAELVKAVYVAAAVAAVGMSAMNVYGIQAVVPETIAAMQASAQDIASIPLSRDGKNVVVLMMDRGISSYIPYLFHEKPELEKQFAGFTYYPNTISFGGFTNFGSPALYGGYEYTPEEMNRRSDERLVDKHNEALKVMPVIFQQEGFRTTVCDPTYAGYNWIPDLSIYDDYPEIRTFNTMGKFNADPPQIAAAKEQTRSRNFFCYSLFKIAPVAMQPTLYVQGRYNNPNFSNRQIRHDMSTSTGIDDAFMSPYAVLRSLSDITDVTDGKENTFLMLSNDTTHDPMLLQEPAYEPAIEVDNREYDALHTDRFTVDGKTLPMENDIQMMHYHGNMAAMIQLGRWFDYLRANDVYDNTKIIIVSDHGKQLHHYADRRLGEEDLEDTMLYNALLMVKDFGATEFTTDNTFMTNGDVPTLAAKDLVQEPVNPFTGKPINSDAKNGEQHILGSMDWDVSVNNGNTFLPGVWFSVHDNIFDRNNWERLS